ncbi:hypothetical protein B0I35DRAFT_143549 [Stachybotrys elegans]|uniref:Uncharacterized protein n=1 Tax=Stachybotrys elegans TaxID=80388 RepID=A0A8K0WWQ6_9HYPO|nr:hypothetical protein B0I35DRAFT_143549 [Stachybotrys elegans]
MCNTRSVLRPCSSQGSQTSSPSLVNVDISFQGPVQSQRAPFAAVPITEYCLLAIVLLRKPPTAPVVSKLSRPPTRLSSCFLLHCRHHLSPLHLPAVLFAHVSFIVHCLSDLCGGCCHRLVCFACSPALSGPAFAWSYQHIVLLPLSFLLLVLCLAVLSVVRRPTVFPNGRQTQADTRNFLFWPCLLPSSGPDTSFYPILRYPTLVSLGTLQA